MSYEAKLRDLSRRINELELTPAGAEDTTGDLDDSTNSGRHDLVPTEYWDDEPYDPPYGSIEDYLAGINWYNLVLTE